MASKIDKMAKLTEGLLSLPDQGAPSAKAKRPVGTPVNLRMPPDLLAAYAAEAGRRSAEKGRTVTAQAVMLEVLTAGRPDRG
ncbi:hypothetical protein [Paracraurococcus lichenis]|uniref:CopG family transcriptional regulator n=1 Tax=Paracraurococcus lichenis TaxID=3064888 RepID=A0ABT9ED71_9PROT|nr:hypothetical protein [Paracraurococcus sp. LOR1-02]MDO9714167.1 hypothetical protein [Paracraurococcus sp. LOR1-02]